MVVVFLVVSDLFTGLISQPLFIAKEISHLGYITPNCDLEDLFMLSVVIFSGSSFLHLVLVAHDRHIAINDPYNYKRRITVNRLTITSIALWGFSIIYNGIAFIIIKLSIKTHPLVYYIIDFQYILGVPVLLTVMVYWYARIFYSLRKIRLQIQDSQLNHLQIRTQNYQRFQKKLTVYTSMILLFGFLIPYSLVFVATILITVLGSDIRSSFFFTVLPIAYTVLLLNSLMNPIVFCLRTAELKKEFLGKVLCRKVGPTVKQDRSDITP